MFEAQVVGLETLDGHDSACGMPIAVQIERLRRELSARLGDGFSVQSTDLYSLEGSERDAALDAVGAGTPSPFVIVEGRIVCTGAVDTSTVLGALAP